MGLLPTYAVWNAQNLILCYGQRTDGDQEIPYLYDLTVVLDAQTMTIQSYSFNHA